jgi:hypothetical protein
MAMKGYGRPIYWETVVKGHRYGRPVKQETVVKMLKYEVGLSRWENVFCSIYEQFISALDV